MDFAKLKNVRLLKKIYFFRLPYLKTYAKLIANVLPICRLCWPWFRSVFFFDQMIRYDCNSVGKDIIFGGTYPLIINRGHIEIGNQVTFVGRNNLDVGFNIPGIDKPKLIIGNDVMIGYASEIHVAHSVHIGDHVRLATGVKIFDNNSHPIDTEKRRNRLPMTAQDVAPVVINDDAWIGIGAIILKGVVIGKGAVIAAGSVVTQSVQDNVIVAGNPAKVVKAIKESETSDAFSKQSSFSN